MAKAAATKRKQPTKVRITAEQRRDWRALSYEHWNVRTLHAYFADMNAEYFGVAEYYPMRNWAFEQGVLKRALAEYGAEMLRAAFDECFRGYRPTPSFPILTAGFAVSYRLNAIMPRLLAEKAENDRRETEMAAAETAEIGGVAW